MPAPPDSDPHLGQPGNPVPDIPAFESDDLDDIVDIEDVEETDDFEEEEEPEPMTPEAQMHMDPTRMEALFQRLSTERVPIRVHDVIIKGNTKTKISLIESEVENLKKATTVQQLLRSAAHANAKLQRLDIFDSVSITLDTGPPELPGTANVIVEVSESTNSLTGDIGLFSRPEARSWSLEGSVKLKNLFGYGDLWDTSVTYGWGQASEVSAGLSVPKLRAFSTPLTARISLLSRDLLKFSSYKERAFGMSLGLVSSGNHNLSYDLSLCTLSDPSQMSSPTVRRQLGQGLLSALKYTFKIDQRDSPLRPTRGHAFVSNTQIGGLVPDFRSLRFIRQGFDLRYAIPLGFYRAALNFGISSSVFFPWGSGFLNTPSQLSERFFMGGNSSPVCTLGCPTSLLGFKARGLGPAEPRRNAGENLNDESSESSGIDFIGGDLTVTAFADFSFDLPLRVFLYRLNYSVWRLTTATF
ncbi:unnamed protein product [Fraxinus pennsylvanica]|uniref:POTRA domain-containing protein n=1 Tax=Fraxinus pennsylvanica TaxID=56036 RepID=A0AAD1ZSW2_9LAMI|nr:unnamed protein product [Fraxinus pennsylvanica]